MRIGRGYPQQSFTVAGQALGPRRPTVFAPVVTTLSVNLAVGLATNQRRAEMRFPLPGWGPGITQTTEASPQTWGSLSRRLGPTPPELIGPLPSQQQQTIRVADYPGMAVQWSRRDPRRAPKSLLSPPEVLAQPPPIAPIQVVLQENRERGFGRRFGSTLSRPAVVEPPLQAPDRRLGIAATLAKTRPRPTHPRFAGPVVVFAPPLAPPIDVVFARRVPPRRTKPSLPLVVFASAAFVATPINVSLQENRLRGFGRRHFPASVLAPPTTLQTFAGPTVRLTSARPRKTGWLLRPPTVVRTPSVEQAEQTIRTLLARIRPRPTSANLAPATTLQVFAGPAVAVVRARPRKTAGLLFEPTVLRIPSVEQREDTVFAALVRVRPRPTVRQLGQPTVLRVFAAAKVTLTEARPRPTTAALAPPTVVRVPAVEQLEQTVRVTLTHARPRPTLRRLRPPTVLRVPAVEQQEQTLRVRLAQSRPRPTSKRLAPPAVIITNPPVVTSTRVALVSLRPPLERTRHVVEHLLRPPTVVIPLPSLRAQTRPSVSLSRTRPRATLSVLTAPTAAAATRAVQDTLRVALATIRPRRTVSLILPSRVRAAAETSISATFARIRPAATAATLAPPTRVRPQEAFLGPATRLAPGRRPAALPLLSPPAVVAAPAPPTPEQLRLLASLTAVETRLRFRVGRSVFPPVLPPAPPETLPPFPESTGYAASGADAPGEALPAADSTGQASPATASQGIAVPVAESTGKAVPGTASDGG